jgi:hypothetical protein
MALREGNTKTGPALSAIAAILGALSSGWAVRKTARPLGLV